jgi:tRNA (adenine-N(1)-)-methyltransferase non-catalytic subunit
VPAGELHADALADGNDDDNGNAETAEGQGEGVGVDGDGLDVIATAEGEELTLVDETGTVVARSNREVIDGPARQALTMTEIEELKRNGASAGKDLIAKLLLSHSAIDQKTAYSLAKYKLLKTKKYLRQFTVLPIDVSLLARWMLEDREASKVMEMRREALALVGCWSDAHFVEQPLKGSGEKPGEPYFGRWLVVDDTSGLLVASLADKMGILYQKQPSEAAEGGQEETSHTADASTVDINGEPGENGVTAKPTQQKNPRKRPRRNDLEVHYAAANTITVLHSSTQPNLSLLRYFDFDSTDPNPPYPHHPLFSHVLSLNWLQLLSPGEDPIYTDEVPQVEPDVLSSWKTSRRANYHRKRRRWARTRHVIDEARAGGFSGLAVASTMDPVSILRHALPLLSGGAPVAIYSPHVEPLTHLADCFSVGRRTAWLSSPPAETQGKTAAELERWSGSDDFPLNPTLLLGATIQTSRTKQWQVLPGRTHPLMTAKGGADGYVFTGWRTLPVEGRIEARGKFQKRRDG